ncbi:MAG: di-heme oxidoredictase family protein [Planctomycetota bacterium]
MSPSKGGQRSRTLLGLALALAGCGAPEAPEAPVVPAGGATTVVNTSAKAFAQPAPNFSQERLIDHFVGNALFNKNWVAAPAQAERLDGLGPLFNARSCSTCHFRDGRGAPPAPGEPAVALLFKVGTRSAEGAGTDAPDEVYGSQFQNFAIAGAQAEGSVEIDYAERAGSYADGTAYALRAPRYLPAEPGYGPFSDALFLTPRIAPAVFGVGLLEGIPEDDLLARADPDDADGDGISGRVSYVTDMASGETVVGRFGWKAGQPTVDRQVAAALLGDMGISSSLVGGVQNHGPRQAVLDELPTGGTPEIDDVDLERLSFYMRTLGVPARRKPRDPGVRRGAELFESVGCNACHVPVQRTLEVAGMPELSDQSFAPYTDLLLHDMGDELSDDRPEGDASGREWRTPPLWGIGLIEVVNDHQELLHDGRARGVAEAILWHGGEGAAARDAFRALSTAERADLVAFVEDL